MSRYFNYLENKNELYDAYYICKKIIKEILNFDTELLNDTEKNIIFELRNELIKLNESFNFSAYDIQSKITNELLEPQNVEYAFKYKHYPANASITGEKINNLFNRIFDIEDKVQIIVANMWNRIITPFSNIKNGENFITIGHSGPGYIVLPPSKYYRNNDYNNTTTISCSIFMNESMNTFNSNLVMIFDITPDNFICANNFDSVTKFSDSNKNIKTLKIIEQGKIISAGFTNMGDESKIVIKCENPINTIRKIKNKNDDINEVVLDKQKSKAAGLVLFSNGSDFLFSLYLDALKMKEDYNLELKVINKSLYKNTTITLDKLNNELLQCEKYILSLNLEYSQLCSLLDGYITEVVIPLRLNPLIEKTQLDFIEQLKEKTKKFQY